MNIWSKSACFTSGRRSCPRFAIVLVFAITVTRSISCRHSLSTSHLHIYICMYVWVYLTYPANTIFRQLGQWLTGKKGPKTAIKRWIHQIGGYLLGVYPCKLHTHSQLYACLCRHTHTYTIQGAEAMAGEKERAGVTSRLQQQWQKQKSVVAFLLVSEKLVKNSNKVCDN